MLSPEAALEIILNSVPSPEMERVALRDSFGRVLAEDVIANENLPPFDNSAMDGYAVIAEDTQGAGKDDPRKLSVIAEQPAGKVSAPPVTPGNAVRIMTGAPMPAGADAVVMVEHTEFRDGEVFIYRETTVGANVRRSGEDVKPGQLVLKIGQRIGPAHMGMLASLGHVQVAVSKKLRVAIITTGDELVDVGEHPGPGQIRNGNQYSILGEALGAGAEVSVFEHVGDRKEEIERVLKSAPTVSDLVIVCGGVSVGDYDYVKDIMANLGEMLFWKVAIKPGKPLAFGRIGGIPVFGLPGNPVSCLVTFDLFVRPAILRMTGCGSVDQTVVSGTVTEDVRHKPGPREFMRAVTVWRDGGYCARPIPKHGSGMLSSMVEANSYLVIHEDTGDVPRGEQVEIILFGPTPGIHYARSTVGTV